MPPVIPESIPDLPFELWSSISSHLPNSDIKSMRLVCKRFHNVARLRLHRVFLSANLLNIKVFRAITDHNTFRHGVTEIVWDDSRFLKGPRRFIYAPDRNDELITDDDKSEDEAESAPGWTYEHSTDEDESEDIDEYLGPRHQTNDGCPRWFKKACRQNLQQRSQRKRDIDRPGLTERAEPIAGHLPLKKCWEYY